MTRGRLMPIKGPKVCQTKPNVDMSARSKLQLWLGDILKLQVAYWIKSS